MASVASAALPSHAASTQLDFNRDIRPILSGHCLQCHGPDAATRKGDLRLDQPSNVFEKRGDRHIIVPGKPAQSEMVGRITSDDPDVKMPPPESPRPLSPDQIKTLQAWIRQGATWDQHWSFTPPKRPPLPRVKNAGWPMNGVDYFVLARLEQEGLEPSPRADRATLIRRVTLALTGLPPTPEEVDAFLKDPSPHAYGHAVERLLNSSRYGEHMAWAWLNAARYSDTSGYQADWERFMWPWRDWVVNALNDNMPFDQFTIEQLAGDMLPGATPSQKLATGFNRNHRINDEGGSLDAEFEVEYVVDRVDTTATIWLGLTAGCARCHDHKYDPLSQKEYYRLFAFFNNVPEKGIDGRKGAARPFMDVPNEAVQMRLGLLKAQLAETKRRAEQASDNKALDEEIKRLEGQIKNLEKKATTQVMVMLEKDGPPSSYLLKRGQYTAPDKSEPLFPAIPSAFGDLAGDEPANRLGLAKWLVHPRNPLTARVTVNRYWQHHFGTGLVRTSEDFGSRGEAPSHPQLLDWLATEFLRMKWDLKAFHRLIVTSAAFQQSSAISPDLLRRDPKNRLLARGPRMRLGGPAIRDQALMVSGLLVPTMGGPSVKPYQPPGLWKELSFGTGKTTVDFYRQDKGDSLYRRSLYTFWKRTVAPPRMSVFSGVGREACRVRDEVTNTPLQALTLQNDVTFVEAARHLAARMIHQGGPALPDRIRFGWRLLLARHPEADELSVLEEAFKRYAEDFRDHPEEAARLLEFGDSPRIAGLDATEHAAYTMIAQTLLNLDETITLE